MTPWAVYSPWTRRPSSTCAPHSLRSASLPPPLCPASRTEEFEEAITSYAIIDVDIGPADEDWVASPVPSLEQRSASPEQVLEATTQLATLLQQQEEVANRQRRHLHDSAAAQHASAEAQRLVVLEQVTAANAAAEVRA